VRRSSVDARFVEFIPEVLEEGILYVSQKYSVASHNCCCGCGKEVVTPLSPTDWQIKREDSIVSLHPSIGNWSFPCRSHYFLKRNRVEWAGDMHQQDIDAGIAMDRENKARYYSSRTQSRSWWARFCSAVKNCFTRRN